MIEPVEYTLFNETGVLIKFDGGQGVFLTNTEAEQIKVFLNERQ